MEYTVIVPVYNGEDTIAECLKALLNQREAVYNQDYTVLVIDDGSTDRTPNIVREFPVSVIRLARNEGRITARLTGAKEATTKRLLFVDSRVFLPDNTRSPIWGICATIPR